jgi:hypothetical protein
MYKNSSLTFCTNETLTQSAFSLMKWVTQNITPNAQILVSSGDIGQFVTAVNQIPTICCYSYLANYSNLMVLLPSNSSELTALLLLVKYSISYVYIGSIPTTYALENSCYRHSNSPQFLLTPYFNLTKEIRNAWLFQSNA